MLFHWNLHSGLLFPCFVQGMIFTIIYLVQAKRQAAPHWAWLASIIFFYTLFISNWMIGFAGWYDSHDGYTSAAYYIPWANWLMIGPLVYFYFRTLTNRRFHFEAKHWWHLALPLTIYGYQLFMAVGDLVFIRDFPAENHYGTFGPLYDMGFGIFGQPLRYLAYLSILYYFILTIRHFWQYERYLGEYFSEVELLNFRWLSRVLYAIVVIQLIWWSFEVVSIWQGESLSYINDWYKFMATGILIFYLSLVPFRNEPPQARQLAFDPELVADTDVTPLAPRLAQRVLEEIETRQLYLQENLTLDDLAASLGESSTLVSKAINDKLDQNFNTCINQFRVAEAQRRLTNPDYAHLSILGIAYDCGFSSKATFNRVFKQFTGQSPSAWRKSQNLIVGSNS